MKRADASPPNLFDLTGHVAVVTGGGTGIGLGFAEGLAQAGASLALLARDVERLESAAEGIRRHGNPVITVRCDVGVETSVREAMDRVVTELGGLDSCFANAGLEGPAAPFVETSLEAFRSVTSVNLDGAFLTMREAARHMIKFGKGGSLVATSSMGSRYGMPGRSAYGASKAGLIAMVNSIAVELARHGIRANCVLPGWVSTAMAEPLLNDPKFGAAVLSRVPQRRWGDGDDFAGIAVYLASAASAYQTGDTILIDGGYSIF